MIIQMPLLDVMVATACQLKCAACTNGMGIVKQEIFDTAQIKSDIDNATQVIHADIAVLLGGEPLVHHDLIDLMRHTKKSGIAEKVRVLTNGMRLHRMTDEFWYELEDLKISIYPGKTPGDNIELAHAKQRVFGFDLSFYDVAADPFRAIHTTELRDDRSAQATWDACWYRSNTRKIEQGHFFRCCTSSHLSQQVLGLPPDHDGIPLAGLTYRQLAEFLARPVFMESCRRCHGNNGPSMGQWTEERNSKNWLEASSR